MLAKTQKCPQIYFLEMREKIKIKLILECSAPLVGKFFYLRSTLTTGIRANFLPYYDIGPLVLGKRKPIKMT